MLHSNAKKNPSLPFPPLIFFRTVMFVYVRIHIGGGYFGSSMGLSSDGENIGRATYLFTAYILHLLYLRFAYILFRQIIKVNGVLVYHKNTGM